MVVELLKETVIWWPAGWGGDGVTAWTKSGLECYVPVVRYGDLTTLLSEIPLLI